jgi:hypothetical protein
MVDQADDPAVEAGDRDDAMRHQEGDQRDRRGGERGVRCGRAPADDRADRDGDREVECAELGKGAPFPQAQADDSDREQQDSLDRHPSQTTRPTDQFSHVRPPCTRQLLDAAAGDHVGAGLTRRGLVSRGAWVRFTLASLLCHLRRRPPRGRSGMVIPAMAAGPVRARRERPRSRCRRCSQAASIDGHHITIRAACSETRQPALSGLQA